MTEPTVHLTSAAVQNATKQLAKRGTPNAYLRLGLKGGSCSGYEYSLSYADEKHSRDLEFSFDELKVLVDPKSIVYLNGATLDYERSLMSSGFVFKNPNAINQCGCGMSFEVRGVE